MTRTRDRCADTQDTHIHTHAHADVNTHSWTRAHDHARAQTHTRTHLHMSTHTCTKPTKHARIGRTCVGVLVCCVFDKQNINKKKEKDTHTDREQERECAQRRQTYESKSSEEPSPQCTRTLCSSYNGSSTDRSPIDACTRVRTQP